MASTFLGILPAPNSVGDWGVLKRCQNSLNSVLSHLSIDKNDFLNLSKWLKVPSLTPNSLLKNYELPCKTQVQILQILKFLQAFTQTFQSHLSSRTTSSIKFKIISSSVTYTEKSNVKLSKEPSFLIAPPRLSNPLSSIFLHLESSARSLIQ